MKCPACLTPLAAPEASCPLCKLSLQRLDIKFGLVPRHSRYLSDRSGRLDLREMESLRKSLRLFEKKFPQILLSIFITELPAGHGAGEYAFWMANRARFSSLEKTEGDNFDLLLVIDAAADTAALVAGYGLEAQVSEEALQRPLDVLASRLRAGKWADGLHAFLQALSSTLRDCSTNTQMNKQKVEEK